MDLSHNDTTAVYDLTNQFLDYLKNQDLDAAMGMLHYLKDGMEIVSLPQSWRSGIAWCWETSSDSPTKSTARFLNETDCQVNYNATLFEKAEDDPVSNKISFYIKPVRREGQWYLTLADTQTDSTWISN